MNFFGLIIEFLLNFWIEKSILKCFIFDQNFEKFYSYFNIIYSIYIYIYIYYL